MKAQYVESWYVYYKLPAQAIAGILPQVEAMQRAIEADTGITGRIQQRTDIKEGVATLMEIYEGVGDVGRFEAALLAHARGCLPTELSQARRVERFRPV